MLESRSDSPGDFMLEYHPVHLQKYEKKESKTASAPMLEGAVVSRSRKVHA